MIKLRDGKRQSLLVGPQNKGEKNLIIKPPNLRKGQTDLFYRDCYFCRHASAQSPEQWEGKKISCDKYEIETDEYQICDDFMGGRKYE